MRRRRTLGGFAAAIVVATLFALTPRTGFAQPTRATQQQVEAVFLFRFSEFVEWPTSTDRSAPFVIGVLGEDPFGFFLDETVRGEQVSGRPIQIRRFARLDEVGPCDILFVSESERSRMSAIRAALQTRHILTVADFDGFANDGGVIQFAIDAGKTRLKINVAAAQSAGLTISSKLLRSAEIVGAGK